MKRIVWIIGIVLMLWPKVGYCQDLYFHTIGNTGDLGYSTANSFAQDEQGFIWLTTNADVLRFDGSAFKSYSEKITSHGNWLIQFYDIIYTSTHQLYVASSRGLWHYCPQSDDFICVCDHAFRTIYEDTIGLLWLVNNEIYTYDPQTNHLSQVLYNEHEVTGQMYTDPSLSDVYFASRLSLPPHLSQSLIVSLRVWNDTLYILTERDGLWQYCNDQYQLIAQFDQFVVARHLMIDRNGSLWVGTMSGICVIDRQSHTQAWYVPNYQPGSLTHKSIQSLFEDREGNIWLGTYGGGMCCVNHTCHNAFHTLYAKDYDLLSVPISALCLDGDKIWMGTEGDGIYCYHATKGIVAHYTQQSHPTLLQSNNIKALALYENQLWIATYLGGLSCLNTQTGMAIDTRAINAQLLSNQIYDLALWQDELWMIYQNPSEIVSSLSLNSGQVKSLPLPLPEGKNVSSRYRQLLLAEDTMWITTTTSLLCYSLSNQEYGYCVSVNQPLIISVVCFDPRRKCLWIGTKNRGLISYQLDKKEFVFEHSDYLPKLISTVTVDEDYLWLGGRDGIYRYYIPNGEVVRYDHFDGVPELVFSAMAKADTSMIYIGGMGTLTTVNTQNICINDKSPTTLLSDVQINGQSVYAFQSPYMHHIGQLLNGELELKHDENNLAIRLANTNYVLSEKNRYRYRFVKASAIGSSGGEMQEMDGTLVSLLQLAPGTYCLQVQSCNNDGVWGEIMQLNIRVKPIFWASAWAWLLYLLVIGGIVAYYVFLAIRHRRMKNELYKATVQQQEEDKANRAKVRFFTDVSKEIRGPLLQLQSVVDVHHVPYIQQMLDAMTKYTDKYCIDTGTNPKEQKIDNDLRKLTDLIDQRLAGHIDIDELAREMGMSRRKLFGFVKDNTGKSIIEYIRSYRISTASKLLLEQNLPVLEVMDKVGIDSQSYFIKTFKKEYGLTPADFVAKMSNKNAK